MAESDYFLKIDGIEGESSNSAHKGEIEVESWSWSETHPSQHAGAAGAAGKVVLEDFKIVMRVSKASPDLLLACASGKHLKSAVLSARKAGRQQHDYLVYRLSQVIVTSYETDGSADDDRGPVDQISLGFGRIEVEYRPQNSDGSLGVSIRSGWDFQKNTKI